MQYIPARQNESINNFMIQSLTAENGPPCCGCITSGNKSHQNHRLTVAY
jgi:hypothetical protein